MLGAFAVLLMSGAQPGPAADLAPINPRAIELFERDPKLKRWAVGFFDLNDDRRLSTAEADVAARHFKHIADGNRDGRVTPSEYRSARDFIVARWAMR